MFGKKNILSTRLIHHKQFWQLKRLNSTQFQDEFKVTMSRICSPAMILTAGCEPKKGLNSLHGMTLSSVCSLSVYPNPLLQFNLHLPSYTSKSLHENDGYLALHMLPPSPKAALLGRTFASGIKRDPRHFDTKPKVNDDGSIFHEMTTPFTKIDSNDFIMHKVNEKVEIPILKELERVFVCNKKQVFEVDNHEIWVVNVLQILNPNANYSQQTSKTGGLLYYDRGFHKVGASLRD